MGQQGYLRFMFLCLSCATIHLICGAGNLESNFCFIRTKILIPKMFVIFFWGGNKTRPSRIRQSFRGGKHFSEYGFRRIVLPSTTERFSSTSLYTFSNGRVMESSCQVKTTIPPHPTLGLYSLPHLHCNPRSNCSVGTHGTTTLYPSLRRQWW